jgi:hypothetical protein
LFAFNVDAAESDVKALPATEVSALGQRLGAAVVDTVEAYQRLDQGRRFGAEVWQAVLVALLVLLFVEVLLQQRIGRA